MISLLKPLEYKAFPFGKERTVKALSKEVAVEYFKSIDPSITEDQVHLILSSLYKTGDAVFSIESTSEAFPTHTNL